LTGGLTASSAVVPPKHQTLQFSSLNSENALEFCHGLAAYLGGCIGGHMQLVESAWQDAERMLYAFRGRGGR
jgi:hypothetical protein